jgi:D-sedoheptulose 7-phosphate isomerase
LNSSQFLDDYFELYRQSLFGVDVKAQLIELHDMIRATSVAGRKVMIAGNGGSAAIAAHCAVDFSKNARARCLNFGDSSLVTCLANDYGYDRWMEKALAIYGDEGDLVILISSSGKSANVVKAADYARERGNAVVTFTGFDENNPLRAKGNLNFWVSSRAYNIVEMTHHIWLLAVCDLLIGKAEYSAS